MITLAVVTHVHVHVHVCRSDGKTLLKTMENTCICTSHLPMHLQTGLTCISWRAGRGPAGCPARWTGCLRRGRRGPPSPVQSTAEGSHVSVPAPDTGTAAD